MILYYSGTHNTSYAARSLADLLDDEAVFIPHTNPRTLGYSGEGPLIFAFPVYSWGIPPLVKDFIKALPESFIDKVKNEDIPVILVCTAGDEVARTPEMFGRILADRGLGLTAVWSVIMPNNYVLLPGFDVDPVEVEKRKQTAAGLRIRRIADKIRNKEWERDYVVGSMPALKSGLIYPLFVRWGINPRRWMASADCIGCGQCAQVCPVGNIDMKENRPEWGKDCVSCTACYHICPVRAISYGSFTKGKGRYFCRLLPIKKSKQSDDE